MVDALIDLTFQRDQAELQQHRAGRRVDQVAPDRQLHHRAVALRNVHEAR